MNSQKLQQTAMIGTSESRKKRSLSRHRGTKPKFWFMPGAVYRRPIDSELCFADSSLNSYTPTLSRPAHRAVQCGRMPIPKDLPKDSLDALKKICYSIAYFVAVRRNPLESAAAQTGQSACDFKIEAQLMRHSNTLYAYLKKRIPAGLRSTISPEDILQEVWMVAANKLHDLQPSDEVGAWLMNVTKNKLADAIKVAVAVKRGGRKHFEYNVTPAGPSEQEPFAFSESMQRTPSSEDAAREAACAVRSAVRVLPVKYREAVALRYFQEESISVIARHMQSTVPATRGLLYRGIRMLREHLGPAWRFFSDDGSFDADPGSPQDDQ